MLITAVELAYALCRCSHSAMLPAPQKSSRASSCRGISDCSCCSTFFSTSRGHLSLDAELFTPASCIQERLPCVICRLQEHEESYCHCQSHTMIHTTVHCPWGSLLVSYAVRNIWATPAHSTSRRTPLPADKGDTVLQFKALFAGSPTEGTVQEIALSAGSRRL